MKHLRYFTIIGSLAAWAAGGALVSSGTLQAQERQEGFQELTRGPVHEAFASTVNFDPEPGMIVDNEPPDLIEEIPPGQRPTGDNVTWISGYWGWDQEESDFIWISGIWRNLPPDRQWVPGYWGDLDTGWQWTSGYWADEEAQEVVYLPQPPRTVETGPNIAAPSDSHIWVSGTWVNRESRYAWRPGYWEPGQENWTWVPAHYQWTRRGYVFIEGYWDYNVHRRGVVFAPVRFHNDYYSRPNYHYTPSTVISLNVFFNHLFVRPSYGHYYFGDYYEPRYRNDGYYASYSYHSDRRGYDPIYAHSRWEHRSDQNWERSRRDDFSYYRDNVEARPPHTWAAMNLRSKDKRRDGRDNYEFAQPLEAYADQSEGRQRFEEVSKESRERYVTKSKQTREFTKSRRLIENRADERPDKERGNVRSEKLSKSPVAGMRSDQLAAGEAPPKRQEGRDDKKGEAKSEAERGADTGKRSPKKTEMSERESKEPREQSGKIEKEKIDGNRGKANSDGRDDKRDDKRPETTGESAKKETGKKETGKKGLDSATQQKIEPTAGNSGKKEARPDKAERITEKKPETAPQRKEQPAKERKKQEAAPERKALEQRAARQPEKERQAKPEAKITQPQAQKREVPKQQVRQAEPQRQAKRESKKEQVAKPQAPKREAPKQEVRQQREAPKRVEQKREAPQRAEQPRKEARPAPEQRGSKEDESRSKKNSGEGEKKKK